MKLIKVLFLVILFNGVSNIHADIGTHNFQINVGSGYSTGFIGSGLVASENLDYRVNVPGYRFGGAIFKTEIAYLLHGVRPNGLVNGLDIRANFMMSWKEGLILRNPTGEISQSGTSLGGGTQIAYTLGTQLKNGSRVMFDILGMGVSVHQNNVTRTINYKDGRNSKTKDVCNNTSISFEYILPGINYISKGGLTIGVRNILTISAHGNFDILPFVGFVTGAYVGFTFGK